MDAKLLFVHALSPLHAGTGQGVGVIDLPIAREKATNLPYLPSSSVKGVLRDECDSKNRKEIFGPDTNHADEHASSVQFTDQRLLLIPIRSLRGTFAWVTSPLVLHRFLRDTQMAKSNSWSVSVPQNPPEDTCLVTTATALVGSDGKVTVEDLPLNAQNEADMDLWATKLSSAIFPKDTAWQSILTARLCLVNDDALGFLLETATEVVARIALEDETKTVKEGALWYEESLPAETILNGLVIASPTAKAELNSNAIFAAIQNTIGQPLQFGGKSTVGRGLCTLQMIG